MNCLVLLLDTDGVFLAGPDHFLAPADASVGDLQQLIFEKHSTELGGIGHLAITIYSCLQQRDAKTPLNSCAALADLMGVGESLQSPLIAMVPSNHERVKEYLHHVCLIDLNGQEIKWPASIQISTTTTVRALKSDLQKSKVLGTNAWMKSINIFASSEDYAQHICLHDSVLPLALKRDYSKERPLIVALDDEKKKYGLNRWIRELTPSSLVSVDWADRTVRIPQSCVRWPGISRGSRGGDVILYCRQQVLMLWRDLQRCCIESNALVYIVGSSGSGKTAAAFVFASTLIDRTQWDVVWLHYTNGFLCTHRCTKWDGDSALRNESSSMSGVSSLLDSCCSRPTIVIFDGYEESDRGSIEAYAPFVVWWSGDKIRRRLVCVTSMVSAMPMYDPCKTTRLPARVDVDGVAPTRLPLVESVFEVTADEPLQEVRSIVELQLSAWSKGEYLEAVQCDALFEVVEPNLRPAGAKLSGGETPLADRVALVESKFVTVGAYAFLMFAIDVEEADSEMNMLATRWNLDELVSGAQASASTRSDVNELQAFFFRSSYGFSRVDRRLVSPYVARTSAFRASRNATTFFSQQDDPSSDDM